MRCRKTLDLLINCTTEEAAQQIRSISALMVVKSIFDGVVLLFTQNSTAWKVSKYGVISGQYFPVSGLNTGKYENTRNNSVFGHFSRRECSNIFPSRHLFVQSQQ